MPENNSPTLEEQEKMLGLELGRNHYLTRIGHNAAVLDSILRQNQIVERLALKTQEGTVGQPGDPPKLEENMGVSVGNTITNYYPQAPSDVPSAPAAPTSPIADFLKKAAIAAALTAGGAGVGVGIPWLLGAFEKAAPAVVPAATEAIDTNTQYELRIGSGATP